VAKATVDLSNVAEPRPASLHPGANAVARIRPSEKKWIFPRRLNCFSCRNIRTRAGPICVLGKFAVKGGYRIKPRKPSCRNRSLLYHSIRLPRDSLRCVPVVSCWTLWAGSVQWTSSQRECQEQTHTKLSLRRTYGNRMQWESGGSTWTHLGSDWLLWESRTSTRAATALQPPCNRKPCHLEAIDTRTGHCPQVPWQKQSRSCPTSTIALTCRDRAIRAADQQSHRTWAPCAQSDALNSPSFHAGCSHHLRPWRLRTASVTARVAGWRVGNLQIPSSSRLNPTPAARHKHAKNHELLYVAFPEILDNPGIQHTRTWRASQEKPEQRFDWSTQHRDFWFPFLSRGQKRHSSLTWRELGRPDQKSSNRSMEYCTSLQISAGSNRANSDGRFHRPASRSLEPYWTETKVNRNQNIESKPKPFHSRTKLLRTPQSGLQRFTGWHHSTC